MLRLVPGSLDLPGFGGERLAHVPGLSLGGEDSKNTGIQINEWIRLCPSAITHQCED